MYLVDFIFDGLRLSNFGCMVGSAVTGNNDTIEMGSIINLETNVNHGSFVSEIVNADYDDPTPITFDIFKNPCGHGHGDYFEDTEVSWFMRWLNRKEYCKFIPIYDDAKDFYRLFFMGTFTECKAINIQGQVYGFAVTFTPNSPFAYLDYKPTTFNVIDTGESFSITNPFTGATETFTGGKFTMYDESEELGSIYPKMFKITTAESGRLIIKSDNDTSNRYTEVKNCGNNEVITFDCIHQIIETDRTAHYSTLYNDFNYVFPRLSNEFYDRKNVFHLSLDCTVEIDYNPIRKVGVIA